MMIEQYNMNLGKPMLVTPQAFTAFKHKYEKFIKADCGDLTLPDCEDDKDECDYTVIGDIAILDFKGFTVNDCDELTEFYCGCISLQRIQNCFRLLLNDNNVQRVIINFDSGGGYVQGTDETVSALQALSAKKETYAFTSGLMCSAAFKIASQCRNIVASPSSMVGSIGVYCEYFDYTKMMDTQGIVVKTFQGGEKKTIGSPFIPLTPEQEKEIQDDINVEWEAFKALVRQSRGDVKEEWLQGQAFSGKEAMTKETKLIDGNINTLFDFVELLSPKQIQPTN